MTDVLQLLVVIVLCCAAAFYAGWKAASAYLPAARAVSDVSNVAVKQANEFAVMLDVTKSKLSSLERAVDENAQGLGERSKAVEEALQRLFEGLERAGVARPQRTTGLQYGEGAGSS